MVLTRKNALFAGSDEGARHWAEVVKVPSALADGIRPEGMAMTLVQTAKLNGVEPMAWLTDVLERVVSGRTRAHELHTLLPWMCGNTPLPAGPDRLQYWPPDAVIDRPD